MEIFPLKYGDFTSKIHSGDFSIAILKNFNEDLSTGDFSFWRFVCGDFSLKNYFGDWTFEKILMKICSWRFFLEDLFWRLKFWNNFNVDLFMEIFPLEYGFGDFSFEKWRIFLWKMKNFPFENGNFFFMITK